MIRALRSRILTLLAIVATAVGLTIITTQPAAASSGDAYLYHTSTSNRSYIYVCRDWGETACSSTSQKRDLYRNHSTKEWGWPDADGAWVPAGYDIRVSGVTYHGTYGWFKISGCWSCTKSIALISE
jgi:hypothetical protein